MNREFCFNKIVNELDPVDFKTFKESKEDFYTVVTNVESGEAEYIKIEDLKETNQLEYLRASGSMPFVSKFVEINNKKYNSQVEKIIELEKEKKIFVLRPSWLVDIKRIEKDENKIQEMYDLGQSDMKQKLESLKEYLAK